MNVSCRIQRGFAIVLVLVGLGMFGVPFLGFANPSAHAQSAPGDPPPPDGVKATVSLDGSVLITWNRKVNPEPLGGYRVYRNGSRLIQLASDGNGGPTTYTDVRPPDGQAAYTVAAYDVSGRQGALSPEAIVQPPENADKPAATDGNTEVDKDGNSRDVKQPSLRGNNSPTAFELYASSSGRIHDTYGLTDKFVQWIMAPVSTAWYATAMLSYLALTILAWAVTKKFYVGLIGVVGSFTQTIFNLSIYTTLIMLAWIIGVGALGVYLAKGRNTLAMRGVVVMLIGMIGATVYAIEAQKIIPAVMTAPLTAGQYILGYTERLMPQQDENNNFGLSVQPTYNGDPAEQGIRRFQETEYVNGVYPGVCKMNFGDIEWATTNYVPNNSDTEVRRLGFDHLTYCEYYVRSVKLGVEDDYLTSQVEEHAPAHVWEFFQGQNWLDHSWYAFLLLAVITVRTLLICTLALSFVLGVLLLGIGLIKLTLLILGWLIPPAQPVVNRVVIRSSIPATLPIFLALLAIISLALSAAGSLLYEPFGWTGMMIYQLFIVVATLIVAWKARHFLTASSKRLTKPGTSDRGSTGASGSRHETPSSGNSLQPARSTARAGATIAAGAASGGTSAAVKAAKVVATWNRRKWVRRG